MDNGSIFRLCCPCRGSFFLLSTVEIDPFYLRSAGSWDLLNFIEQDCGEGFYGGFGGSNKEY